MLTIDRPRFTAVKASSGSQASNSQQQTHRGPGACSKLLVPSCLFAVAACLVWCEGCCSLCLCVFAVAWPVLSDMTAPQLPCHNTIMPDNDMPAMPAMNSQGEACMEACMACLSLRHHQIDVVTCRGHGSKDTVRHCQRQGINEMYTTTTEMYTEHAGSQDNKIAG